MHYLSPPRRAECLALLSKERQARARAQHGEENFLRSLGAGLLLRRYVGSGTLAYGPYGKPSLAGAPAFSLSHGGSLAVLALSDDDSPVGVDTEHCERPWRDAVARRVFCEAEQRWLQESPEERFYLLWTRKEAVLKCCGRGFSRSPSAFSVIPGEVCLLDGKEYFCHTLRCEGHILSAAATRPFTPELHLLDIEELLDPRCPDSK